MGILELSNAKVEDIARCCWAHATGRLGSENPTSPPILYWNNRYLICACLVHTTLDKTALTINFPFLCYSKMPAFQDTILIPNVLPETSIQVIKVVPKLLRDVFEDVLEKDFQKEAVKGAK